MKGLLLDTHTFLEYTQDAQSFADQVVSELKRASRSNCLYLSQISLWEIAMLHAKRRILLPEPWQSWLNITLRKIGIRLISLEPNICMESCDLPGDFHRDPADCLIVSTARLNHLTLITRDIQILKYANRGFVDALHPLNQEK